MAEKKSGLDKFRDLYLPTVREYEKKLADTLSYYAGPELTKLGQGIFALRPFQNKPDATEFIQNPSLKTGLDLAADTAITVAEATPFGYLASRGATLPGKVAQEVTKDLVPKKKFENLQPDNRKVSVDITDSNITKILEDVRIGDITKGEAAKKINELIPKAGLFSDTSKGTTVVTEKFNELLNSYVKSIDPNDMFNKVLNTKMYKTGKDQKQYLVTPKVKNNIFKAIKIADDDTSEVSYAIKFHNALSNFYKPRKEMVSAADEISYQAAAAQYVDIGKQIFSVLGRNLEDLNLVRKGKSSTTTASDAWSNIKVNEIITDSKAKLKLKDGIIFDDTGLTFSSIKNNLLNKNKKTKDILSQVKSFFENPNKSFAFDVDHIQAPRFGGTNAESNLRLITKGDHVSVKSLSPEKTNAFSTVKSKSAFEDEVYKKSTRIVNLIKQGKIEEATKLSTEIKATVDSFKNTFKNTDFVVGQPYVAKKTGDKTAKYITYADSINLSANQKNIVQKLLPSHSNLPNAGKPFQDGVDEVYNVYADMFNISGPLKTSDMTQLTTMGKKDGGIVGISHLTRPLGNF